MEPEDADCKTRSAAAASQLAPESAKRLAQIAGRVGRVQGGPRLTAKREGHPRGVEPAEMPLIEHYKRLRRTALDSVPPELLGFHSFAPTDDVLTQAEADEILAEVVDVLDRTHAWQRRSADSRVPGSGVAGTQRKTFGCELAGADERYKVIGRSEVPPPLRALGDRLLRFCRAREWPYSHSDVHGQCTGFDQVYVQRYTPHTRSGTLGFHFDSFSQFEELICGVTLKGSCDLLLRKTGGASHDFLPDAPPAAAHTPQTLAVPQRPLSFYAMTGMARFDLQHAVAVTGEHERISITFRTVAQSQRSRLAEMPLKSWRAQCESQLHSLGPGAS